mmetsp:Transcript_31007/g.81529  ORF Transcript_31007/g.81529 Transcript_31007/m.81529 type:complete len:302 (+) Transcript_31007:204-1109(+)
MPVHRSHQSLRLLPAGIVAGVQRHDGVAVPQAERPPRLTEHHPLLALPGEEVAPVVQVLHRLVPGRGLLQLQLEAKRVGLLQPALQVAVRQVGDELPSVLGDGRVLLGEPGQLLGRPVGQQAVVGGQALLVGEKIPGVAHHLGASLQFLALRGDVAPRLLVRALHVLLDAVVMVLPQERRRAGVSWDVSAELLVVVHPVRAGLAVRPGAVRVAEELETGAALHAAVLVHLVPREALARHLPIEGELLLHVALRGLGSRAARHRRRVQLAARIPDLEREAVRVQGADELARLLRANGTLALS